MTTKTILDVVEELRREDPVIKFASAGESVTTGRPTEFELVDWNGRPKFVPSEALATSRMNLGGEIRFVASEELQVDPRRGRPFMYRGQVVRYPTCYPTLFRDAPDDSWKIKALLTRERFQVAELELLLQDHPFTAIANKHGFWVDYHGLAQHYGMSTSLLDLTTDLRVAAFFAVARWDQSLWDEDRKARGKHVPMIDGVGVMYRFDWTAFGPGYSKFFEPVGFGPGLRPARQHAWTFRPKPFVDFQKLPNVSAFEFEHSAAASAEVFSWFNKGAWLMPPDCLASIVEKVSNLPFLTMAAVRHAANQDGQSEDELELAVGRAATFLHSMLGVKFVDGHRLALEDNDLASASAQAKQLDDDLHQMSKGWRIVRTRK